MRLRNIKGSYELINESPYVVEEPEQWQGRWQTLFKRENPIHLEIGVGKGRFIRTLATQNPNVNYIGMEKFSGVLYRAIRDMEPEAWKNLVFIQMDAEHICNLFSKGEVSTLYLNFSDPWPKKRHAKRRLTSNGFLSKYAYILDSQGILSFKTDNKDLFEFSLTEMGSTNWNILDVDYDLHKDKILHDAVMTEYEEKFSKMGYPIYHLTAVPNENR